MHETDGMEKEAIVEGEESEICLHFLRLLQFGGGGLWSPRCQRKKKKRTEFDCRLTRTNDAFLASYTHTHTTKSTSWMISFTSFSFSLILRLTELEVVQDHKS